jgi:hypothetical protein
MRKIGLLCLALVLALGTLGIGYATWSANVTIEQEVYSGELCMEFEDLTCSIDDDEGDPDLNVEWSLCESHIKVPAGKDVASCNCTALDKDKNGTLETMLVTCNNTYPSYYNHLDFWLCNCGTIPYRVQGASVWVDGQQEYYWDYIDPIDGICEGLDLNDDDLDDIEIRWGNCFGDQVHPGLCVSNCSFGWHILQDAPQNTVLQFEIKVHGVQFNKYEEPT